MRQMDWFNIMDMEIQRDYENKEIRKGRETGRNGKWKKLRSVGEHVGRGRVEEVAGSIRRRGRQGVCGEGSLVGPILFLGGWWWGGISYDMYDEVAVHVGCGGKIDPFGILQGQIWSKKKFRGKFDLCLKLPGQIWSLTQKLEKLLYICVCFKIKIIN